ncbi:MAG: hypothetical protein Q8P41_25155 [Pseudomonadota bacterium]|nr:hypothetical protein [Pseudomonadota bacterium]
MPAVTAPSFVTRARGEGVAQRTRAGTERPAPLAARGLRDPLAAGGLRDPLAAGGLRDPLAGEGLQHPLAGARPSRAFGTPPGVQMRTGRAVVQREWTEATKDLQFWKPLRGGLRWYYEVGTDTMFFRIEDAEKLPKSWIELYGTYEEERRSYEDWTSDLNMWGPEPESDVVSKDSVSVVSLVDEQEEAPKAEWPPVLRPKRNNLLEGDDTTTPGLKLASDAPQSRPTKLFVAIHEKGVWYIDKIPATGLFLFVTKRQKSSYGTLFMASGEEVIKTHKDKKPVGHMGIAEMVGCADAVGWAGGVRFVSGHAVRWTNDSGHYEPPPVGVENEPDAKLDGDYWGLPLVSFLDYQRAGPETLEDSTPLQRVAVFAVLHTKILAAAERTKSKLHGKLDDNKTIAAWAKFVFTDLGGDIAEAATTIGKELGVKLEISSGKSKDILAHFIAFRARPLLDVLRSLKYK